MPLTEAAAASPRFHRLTVADIRRETPEAVSIAFAIPPDLADAYRYRSGQYLTLRATLDGEDIRRSYSICSAPGDSEIRVAIKRVEGGQFSVWAQDALHLGDTVEVMTPTGRFGIPREAGPVHIAFAAGSGITPIVSIIRTVLARDTEARVFLFYGSRATAEILFRGALEDLKDRYLGRLSVFHVLSQEQQDIALLNGRLDRAKLDALLGPVLGGVIIDQAYVCGPLGMIETVCASLDEFGLASDRVHVERFASALEGRPRQPAPVKADAPPFAVASLIADGKRTEVPVAEGEAILDAAIRAGLDLPYACRGGMCSTCRARLVEGEVEMKVNYSLEPWETAAGFVLTCQSHPKTSHVVVDYDHQ